MIFCKPSDVTPDKVKNCMNSHRCQCDLLWSFLITDLCVSAAHDTGLVTLQVAVSNQIISNSVVFEYKARALPSLPSSQHDWLSLDGRSSFLSFFAFVREKKKYHFTKSGTHHVTLDYWATWSRWLYNGALAQGFSNYPTFSINKLKAHLIWKKEEYVMKPETEIDRVSVL